MVCKHKSKKIIIFSLFLILVSGCTKADTNIKEAARESNTITIEAASSEPEEDINPSDTLLPEQEDTNNTEPFNIIASIPEENLHLYYGKEEDVYLMIFISLSKINILPCQAKICQILLSPRH